MIPAIRPVIRAIMIAFLSSVKRQFDSSSAESAPIARSWQRKVARIAAILSPLPKVGRGVLTAPELEARHEMLAALFRKIRVIIRRGGDTAPYLHNQKMTRLSFAISGSRGLSSD